MAGKKKDKNGEEYEVVAVATDLEIRIFVDLQAKKAALDGAIKAAMTAMADELEDVEKSTRRRWDLMRKKYNLDDGKKYEVNHTTKEIRLKLKLWG